MSCLFTIIFPFRRRKRLNEQDDKRNHKHLTIDSKNTNTSNTQSIETKSTVTSSQEAGVPFEIGGQSFDESDEISLISCSTMKRFGSFEIIEENGHMGNGMYVNYCYQNWVTRDLNNNLLQPYKREDYDSEDNESLSHFTRVSI